MNDHVLKMLKKRFDSYVSSFRYDDSLKQRNIDLKIDHTWRVCHEILEISRQMDLDEEHLNIAEACALFHDVGRFEQYRRFETFHDLQSVDHGDLGAFIIKRNGLLEECNIDTRKLIVRTTKYHNKKVLPEGESPDFIFFLKLLRDADKLDIWKVVIAYEEEKERGFINDVIELGLSEDKDISAEIIAALLQKQTVDFSLMKTQTDFKMLQIGWVFDINFPPTLERIRKRGYIESIQSFLPRTPQVEEIIRTVQSHLDENSRYHSGRDRSVVS